MREKAQKKAVGLSADTLKLIAIAAMLVDHATTVFVAQYYSPAGSILHAIGRITGPTMFFFIVQGYWHTRSKNRYAMRLAVFALISYLPFIYFRSGALPTADTFLDLNVIFTLFLGFLMSRARHEVKNRVLGTLLMVGILLLSEAGDWGSFAIVCIFIFDFFRESFKKQALAYCALSFVFLLSATLPLLNPFAGVGILLACLVVYGGMLFPIALLSFYNGEKGRLPSGGKWLFYAIYPAHLLILGFLRWNI